MYNEAEASAIRQEFWTKLGQYMAPVPSASNEKVNWINYKTGIKPIQFRMNALRKEAFVAIEIRAEIPKRLELYQFFLGFKDQFPDNFEWIETCEDEFGKPLSRIYCELNGFSVFNRDHWPKLIQFFKENIIFIDSFWSQQKDIFEMIGSN